MRAKNSLMQKLEDIECAVNYPQVIDKPPTEVTHNRAANLLRKGMGIIAFNILEDFLKERLSEFLISLSSAGISFSDLPEKLQEASTLGALKALALRAKIAKTDDENWLYLIHSETSNICSTASSEYLLSKFSFLHAQSNINSANISDSLNAISIKGGWNALKNISNTIYAGVPDLKSSYDNAAKRRHNAAHNSEFKYDYTSLQNIIREIKAISASFDILLTTISRLTEANTALKLEELTSNYESSIKFRFLYRKDDYLYEKKGPCLSAIVSKTDTFDIITARTIKKWPDLQVALENLQPNLQRKQEFLIILNASASLSDWYM